MELTNDINQSSDSISQLDSKYAVRWKVCQPTSVLKWCSTELMPHSCTKDISKISRLSHKGNTCSAFLLVLLSLSELMQCIQHFYHCWNWLFGTTSRMVCDRSWISGMYWKWHSHSCIFIIGNKTSQGATTTFLVAKKCFYLSMSKKAQTSWISATCSKSSFGIYSHIPYEA